MGGHYRLPPSILTLVHSSFDSNRSTPCIQWQAGWPSAGSVTLVGRARLTMASCSGSRLSLGRSPRPISPTLSRKRTGLHLLSETHADMGFGKDQGGLVQSPVLSCIHSFHIRDQPHPLSRGGLPFPFALLLGHGDGGRKSHAPSRSRRLRAIDGNPVYLVVKGAPHITTRGTLPRSANHGASRFPRQEE